MRHNSQFQNPNHSRSPIQGTLQKTFKRGPHSSKAQPPPKTETNKPKDLAPTSCDPASPLTPLPPVPPRDQTIGPWRHPHSSLIHVCGFRVLGFRVFSFLSAFSRTVKAQRALADRVHPLSSAPLTARPFIRHSPRSHPLQTLARHHHHVSRSRCPKSLDPLVARSARTAYPTPW